MIVGIVLIDTGLIPLQEFRTAVDEATGVTDFCNSYTPALNPIDYLGIDSDLIDLQLSWAWDFASTALVEIVYRFGRPVLASSDIIGDVIELYNERQLAGREFFQEQRAHLYMKLTTSEITMSDAFFIELKLKNVKDYVITGDWLTAQNEINSVIVEGAYTQDIHDAIKAYIDDYVTANY